MPVSKEQQEELDAWNRYQYPTTGPKSALDFRYDPKGNRKTIPFDTSPSAAMGDLSGGEYVNRNPLSQQIYDRQLRDLREFSANKNRYSDELYNSAATGARRDLDTGIKKTRDNYNSRGLLNSGMQRADEEGLRSNTAASLADKRRSINQGLLSQQQGMESNLFGSAQGLTAPGVSKSQQDLSAFASQLGIDMDAAKINSGIAAQAAGGIGKGFEAATGLADQLFRQKKGSNGYGYGGVGQGTVSGGGNFYREW